MKTHARAQFYPESRVILLVDDDPAVREVVCEHLELAGYTVLVAKGGAEAIRLATDFRGPIDLLLADVGVSDVSGPEIAARVAGHRREMKVLYMSAGSELAAKLGLEGWKRDVLEKPFSSEVLLQVVDRLLLNGESR